MESFIYGLWFFLWLVVCLIVASYVVVELSRYLIRKMSSHRHNMSAWQKSSPDSSCERRSCVSCDHVEYRGKHQLGPKEYHPKFPCYYEQRCSCGYTQQGESHCFNGSDPSRCTECGAANPEMEE